MAAKVDVGPAQTLLLGATGQLGRELLRQFREEEVICKSHEALDVTNLRQVQEQIKMLRPRLVINATAVTDVLVADNDRHRCWQVNVQAVDNLVKTCALYGVPLLHVSTGDVFGQPLLNLNGYRETDPTCPLSWMTQTKVMGEQALLGLSQCMDSKYWNYGFRYWLLRTSELIERPGYGAARNAVTQLVYQSRVKGSKTDRAQEVSTATYRSFTYAPHLAAAIVWLARHCREVVSGVYHVAGQTTSYYEFVRAVCLASGDADAFKPAAESLPDSLQGCYRRQTPICSALNCDKWYAVRDVRLPTWQEAAAEFGRDLAKTR